MATPSGIGPSFKVGDQVRTITDCEAAKYLHHYEGKTLSDFFCNKVGTIKSIHAASERSEWKDGAERYLVVFALNLMAYFRKEWLASPNSVAAKETSPKETVLPVRFFPGDKAKVLRNTVSASCHGGDVIVIKEIIKHNRRGEEKLFALFEVPDANFNDSEGRLHKNKNYIPLDDLELAEKGEKDTAKRYFPGDLVTVLPSFRNHRVLEIIDNGAIGVLVPFDGEFHDANGRIHKKKCFYKLSQIAIHKRADETVEAKEPKKDNTDSWLSANEKKEPEKKPEPKSEVALDVLFASLGEDFEKNPLPRDSKSLNELYNTYAYKNLIELHNHQDSKALLSLVYKRMNESRKPLIWLYPLYRLTFGNDIKCLQDTHRDWWYGRGRIDGYLPSKEQFDRLAEVFETFSVPSDRLAKALVESSYYKSLIKLGNSALPLMFERLESNDNPARPSRTNSIWLYPIHRLIHGIDCEHKNLLPDREKWIFYGQASGYLKTSAKPKFWNTARKYMQSTFLVIVLVFLCYAAIDVAVTISKRVSKPAAIAKPQPQQKDRIEYRMEYNAWQWAAKEEAGEWPDELKVYPKATVWYEGKEWEIINIRYPETLGEREKCIKDNKCLYKVWTLRSGDTTSTVLWFDPDK